MPTNAVTFADDEIDMRWKEPYLTEGLNEKAMIFPRGIYRGFDVIPAGVALTITVVAALPKTDHLAVVETQNNYSLTIRRNTGNFNIDLTAYAGSDVVVAVYAIYSIGTVTAAYVRIYTQAEYTALTAAEQNELTILASVTVPGAGLIPAANISYALRTLPWQNTSVDALPWVQVVRNGSFDVGDNTGDDGAVPHWESAAGLGATGYFRRTVSTPDTGVACIEYVQNVAGLGTAELVQPLDVPLQAAQPFICSFRLRRLVIPVGVAVAAIQLQFRDAAGAVTIGASVPFTLTAVDASYSTLSLTGTAPTGVSALHAVKIYIEDLDYGIIGTPIFRIDNVSLLIRPLSQSQRELLEHGSSEYVSASRLAFRSDYGGGVYAAAEILMKYLTSGVGIPTEGALVSSQRNTAATTAPELQWRGRARVGDNMLSAAADARKARVEAPFSSVHSATLIHESTPATGSLGAYRVYMTSASAYVHTYNAYWDGAAWNKDVAGVAATYVAAGDPYHLLAIRRPVDNAPWVLWDNIRYDDASTRQTFQDRQMVLGNILLSSSSDADIARLLGDRAAAATTVRTKIFESGSTDSSIKVRIYRSVAAAVESFEIVCNAYWDQGAVQWNRDVAVSFAGMLRISQTSAAVYLKDTASVATWVDANWGSNVTDEGQLDIFVTQLRRLLVPNGQLAFTNPQAAGAFPSNLPAATAPTANTLYAKNIVKAWGTCTTNAFTVDEGFNFSSVANAAGLARVTMGTAMGSATNYAVVVTPDNPAGAAVCVTIARFSATQFDVLWYEEVAGVMTLVNLAAATRRFSFMVIDAQP